MSGFMAAAETNIAATPDRVWAALIQPDEIAVYMWGSRVEASWEIGSPVTWNGEYDGKAYRDRGKVLAYDEPHVLSVTHYSPLMGQADEPKNYHTLVYTLAADGDRIRVRLTQEGCDDEAQAASFGANWQCTICENIVTFHTTSQIPSIQ
jgi:uncharacterized protein YndB with AHSA1/START domain